ncbi:MAG: RNA polymerase sigma factor [Holophagales bacterium]|jgi:RNA polymerase sigma-70 factor (ECF subfamily)|nr:RNA polymerase sigma factor [Holophagales bacterium]
MDIELEMLGTAAETLCADQMPFEEIVGRHSGMVYSIALRFLGDSGLAEDVAQEAFLRLSMNLKHIKSETHMALWLRRVAARLCIDEQRKFRKRFVPLESTPEPHSNDISEDFLELERIRALVAELPEKTRMTLILRFQEALSPPEIAHTLGTSLNSIKSRLRRGLATLRERLGHTKEIN